jgi:hypothetical protein
MSNKQDIVRALIGIEHQQPHVMTKEEWHECLGYLYQTVASVASAFDQVIDKKKMDKNTRWNDWLEYLYLGYPTIHSEVDRALMAGARQWKNKIPFFRQGETEPSDIMKRVLPHTGFNPMRVRPLHKNNP